MFPKKKEWRQLVPGSLEQVWDFFSRPENLNAITPPDMSFEVLSDLKGASMYEGMIIQYKVSPISGVKMHWTTEITHVRDRQYFIDEQRHGPYALWHHQHHFEPAGEGGVWMTDILHYKVPYGLVGTLADQLFVDGRIEQIFKYRFKAVEDIFGAKG